MPFAISATESLNADTMSANAVTGGSHFVGWVMPYSHGLRRAGSKANSTAGVGRRAA